MIRIAKPEDFNQIYTIINDAAMAYKGIIPSDCWHEPNMSKDELKEQITDGVNFSCYLENNKIIGVMGMQDKNEVSLIRHAYVLTNYRKKGTGTLLLRELIKNETKPILIGTWKAASWAISFYEKNGFSLIPENMKDMLLRKYWRITERQIETSVVLADNKYIVN